jgi:hypothetical protein
MGIAAAIAAWPCSAALADEGGVSFWLPGQNGSFAAVTPEPGGSLPLGFYNYGGSAAPGSLLDADKGSLLRAE